MGSWSDTATAASSLVSIISPIPSTFLTFVGVVASARFSMFPDIHRLGLHNNGKFTMKHLQKKPDWELDLLSFSYGFFFLVFLIFFLETGGRHASAKAQEAVDHMASLSSSTEEISQPGIFSYGYGKCVFANFLLGKTSPPSCVHDYHYLEESSLF